MSTNNEVKEFYAQDVVYRFNKHRKIIFGIVIDSYEYSDSDDSYALQKGQIRVCWLNNMTERVWKQSNVKLLSRCVTPGEIVRRLEQGKETQRGYCRSIKQTATIKLIGTDKVLENVPQERLASINEFYEGAPIALGKKFGRIEMFEQKLTMQAKCGSIVEILRSVNYNIEDTSRDNYKFIDEYHIGQEVRAVPCVFQQPNWIKKSKTMKRTFNFPQPFTVHKVDICNIDVSWCATEQDDKVVREEVKTDDIPNLKVLESVEACVLEVGERRLIKLNASDTFIKKKEWLWKQSAMRYPENKKVVHVISKTSTRKCNKIRRNYRLNKSLQNAEIPSKKEEEIGDEGWSTESEDESISESGSTSSNYSRAIKIKDFIACTVPVEILCMESKATIVWQDGTEEKDIPTTQLYYSISLDEHEFFPGEWVVADSHDEQGKYGVVEKVDYLERIASVKWFKLSTEDKRSVFDSSKDMSVYDIIKHPKFAFRPGSIVFKRPIIENKLGTIIDSCPEGYVQVKWMDGEEEQCCPHEIELLPESLDIADESNDEENADLSMQMSWETESIESIPCDMSYEVTLQNMAARLDFVRSRIIYLKEAFMQHKITENFMFLKNLLMVYDNSSYLDKLLDTSFFSVKSNHYQALLQLIKERAREHGVEIRGRLFSTDHQYSKVKAAERENINKVLKMEQKVNAQIEHAKDVKESGEPSSSCTPDTEFNPLSDMNLCIELLSMLKKRMDLAYAEIIARIGGTQVFSVMTNAKSPIPLSSSTPLPTPPDVIVLGSSADVSFRFPLPYDSETFSVMEEVPETHWYFSKKIEPADRHRFFKAVQKESKLLKESLPPGVWVKTFENRLDLLSVMIRGPNKTPYEDGLFIFDVQLSADYPRSPPLVSFISLISERLNPNLYVEGRVCISLLGTWLGRGSEVWGPDSTLLQLIVSIQGLILVAEPYYNEAGYEKQNESQQGYENSRTYNELVLLKLVQSMTELLLAPSVIFKQEILGHFAENGDKMYKKLKSLVNDPEPAKLEFPLLPVSKGLKLSLNNALDKFDEVLRNVIKENKPDSGIGTQDD